jgi:SH3 domain protein
MIRLNSHSRLTLSWLLIAALLVILPDIALAKGYYVKERVVISLKKSPAENAATIGQASSDDYLEVRDQSGSWVKVVTPRGSEGWVLINYLTEDSPRSLIIEQLNTKLKSSTDNYRMLQETVRGLEKEVRELKYKLSNSSVEVQKSKNSYQKLKDSSSEYLTLEEGYKKLNDADIVKTKKLNELTKENLKLKSSERIRFILIGGGFIILGLVTGFALNALRSRPKQTGYRL